ncbi:MAG TPA: hypothetical protein VG106_00135 [Vicinamibacterales bacterium]|nr:hypothetical protein [Vicinamibacterales bacterium]
MNGVRDREDARWLPSRHHFALFRLGAFLRLLLSRPQPRRGLLLMIDRHQSALENYGVSIWVMLTITAFIAAELETPLGVVFAPLLAILVVQIVILAVGLTLRNPRVTSFLLILLLAAASLHYARTASWAQFVAWQFLALVALNGVAAVVVFLLRDTIARSEATFAA